MGRKARPSYFGKRHYELRSQQRMKVDFQDRSNYHHVEAKLSNIAIALKCCLEKLKQLEGAIALFTPVRVND